jgi:hypothetical protein
MTTAGSGDGAPAETLPKPSAAVAGSAPPPWFRVVVWDSLLGASCPLLPVPIVDDMALARVRHRMVTRLLGRWGTTLQPHQVDILAGPSRPWTVGRLAGKVVVYPIKKLFRKVLYFLAMKEAVDTFSTLFHQGYLLHAALVRGGLGGPAGHPPEDARVRALAAAVHGTLGATDTRPLEQLVLGVFRNSRRLVGGTLRWLGKRLAGRRDLGDLEAVGADPGRLHAGSPEAEQLLDRLLSVLWGEVGYRQRLERELDRRLSPPPAAAGPG